MMRRALIRATDRAYAEWCRESSAVERLYSRWSEAPDGKRARCFAAYAAALEREQRAAEVYADMVRFAAEPTRR
jgi:hypothetical protein